MYFQEQLDMLSEAVMPTADAESLVYDAGIKYMTVGYNDFQQTIATQYYGNMLDAIAKRAEFGSAPVKMEYVLREAGRNMLERGEPLDKRSADSVKSAQFHLTSLFARLREENSN